jgi:hypothetical protein
VLLEGEYENEEGLPPLILRHRRINPFGPFHNAALEIVEFAEACLRENMECARDSGAALALQNDLVRAIQLA